MTNKYNTPELQASYGVGLNVGGQIASNPFEGLNVDAVVAGLSTALRGEESEVSQADLEAAFKVISEQMQAKQAEAAKAMAAEGEAYLAENAKREEIIVTESGLQYEIIEKGDGAVPTKDSTVKTHYHGSLVNGQVFDSSVERGQPAEFPVAGVIAGWTEALQLMPVGSKWRLHIPHNLAYGEQGAGGAIAPYSALIFDIELLEIVA